MIPQKLPIDTEAVAAIAEVPVEKEHTFESDDNSTIVIRRDSFAITIIAETDYEHIEFDTNFAHAKKIAQAILDEAANAEKFFNAIRVYSSDKKRKYEGEFIGRQNGTSYEFGDFEVSFRVNDGMRTCRISKNGNIRQVNAVAATDTSIAAAEGCLKAYLIEHGED